MFSTKVEIKLTKAEPGSWSKLDIPRATENPQEVPVVNTVEKLKDVKLEESDDSDVDLDDIEPINPGAKLTELD